MESIDKEALRQVIIERLERELSTLVAAANSAKEEATDSDSRQEGKFDMRGQLAAYMAAGQAKLAEELSAAIVAYRQLALDRTLPGSPVAAGSLVALDSPSGRTWYFVGPARGGMDVEIGGIVVTVITPASPIGRALVGRQKGEPAALPGGRGPLGIVGATA
jgi:transcription elongation GreA/GreB family factor